MNKLFLGMLLLCSLSFYSCMRQVPPVIIEYPPQAFESMDSVRISLRLTRHMSGRVEQAFYVYEDSLGNQVQHGPEITYFLDGQKKQVQYYRKGKLWGPATYWFDNGVRQGSVFYSEGRLDGVAKSWTQDGHIESVKNWKNGKLHGPQIDYSPEGKIIRQKWWNDNRIVAAPAQNTPVDTVHRDSLLVPSIRPDTRPVALADSTLPASTPAFFPGPQDSLAK